MSKQENKEAQAVSAELANINPFVLPIDRNLEPLDMSAVNQAMGLSGPRIPAESLVDTTFLIVGGKAYQSAYDPTKHVYFCVCINEATGEVFTTSLGGSSPVDTLDALSHAGFNRPLRVTLRKMTSAGGMEYYTFE